MIVLSLILDNHICAYDTDIYRVLTLENENYQKTIVYTFVLVYKYGIPQSAQFPC